LIESTTQLPRHEAERLLVLVTGHRRSEVVLGFEVEADHMEHFGDLVERRLAGEPLQYIEGSVPFGPVQISVDGRVLVPRPETEYLFEKVVNMVHAPKVIVDLCTGSGNLALALKATFPDATVYATDTSPDALAVARSNAEANGLDVMFGLGNLYDPLPDSIAGRVDLLVANPPYLAEGELAALPDDVRNEPVTALVAGPEGDEVVRAIGEDLGRWLRHGGVFAVEVSEFHAKDVASSFRDTDSQVVEDLSGKDRYVIGRTKVK
jgi:release factor glutamine methyltransferase